MTSGFESSGITKAGGALAVTLARVVVPLWLLAGAVLKLVDASPSHLPVALIRWMGALGVDLGFVLRFSIAVELVVVGVMWLLPRLARPIGIAMLVSFLPVLIGDVALGASSCGCFGPVRVHPGVTLAMDLGFLLGLWLLGRRVERLATPVAAHPQRGGGRCGSGELPSPSAPPRGSQRRQRASGPAARGAAGGGLPAAYADWIGTVVEPDRMDRRRAAQPRRRPRLVLFYRRIEHCHALMERTCGPLAVPTTAVAARARGVPDGQRQPFPCDQCSKAELPAGVDWFLQTPVLVRLEDGVVRCAAEVSPEAPACLEE
jgi:hypothetical protein